MINSRNLQMLYCELNINFQNVWPPWTNLKSPTEDFLATVLPKLCQQVELKNSEIGKTKN